MTEMVIRTEGLTRDFRTTRAVDKLCIEVPRGTVYGFLGPNGSGKTTTIRMLLGILTPTSGRAEVLGFDVAQESQEIRRRCGALLEYSGIYERLSAEDNLEFYGRICELPASARRARIKDLLQSFGLWDRRKDGAGTWSRGMKQKLAVARAILQRPDLVFLDEPTSGLDPVAATNLREELSALVRREGITVFLTTHNLSEAEKLCSKVAVICNGKLLAQGSPEDLRAQFNGYRRTEIIGRGFSAEIEQALRRSTQVNYSKAEPGRLLVELKDQSELSSVLATLVGMGIKIQEVRNGTASLEDVFLALINEEHHQ